MEKIKDLRAAFVIKIQALYDIEKQLEKALPKLAKAATDPELKDGFLHHVEETKSHRKRLEEIFSMLGVKPRKLTCEGIRGIIEDGNWVAKVSAPEPLKDGMIAGAARYAEHYEMAGYLGAIVQASILGMDNAVDLLKQTLMEEERTDKKLQDVMRKSLKES